MVGQDLTAKANLNFQTLFETEPRLYVVYDLNLIVVGGSNAYFDAINKKREEVIGRHLYQAFANNPDGTLQEGVQNLYASLAGVLKNRKPDQMTVQKYNIHRSKGKGGGYEECYWVSINSPVLDENAEIIHLIQRSEDRTELEREKQELQCLLSLDPSLPQEHGLLLPIETANLQVEKILSSISEAFYTLDRQWRFTYVNDHLCELIGMERHQLLGCCIWDLFPDVIDNEVYHQFYQAMVEQKPSQADYLYPTWNRWYRHRVYPSMDGLTVFARDITEAKQDEFARNQAETSLSESESRLQIALAGAQQGIWDWDLTNQVLIWDEGCKAIFGLPADFEVTYEWHIQALHPEDRQRLIEATKIAREHHSEFDMEYRTYYPDQTMRWVLARGRFFYDVTGEPYRMTGTVMDITDRKQAEAALRTSELKFGAIFDQTSGLLGIINLDGVIVEINQSALDSIQAQKSDIIGKYFWETPWWTHSQQLQSQLRESVEKAINGQIASYEVSFPNGAGTTTVINFSLTPVFDEVGQVVMLIAEGYDITQRLQALAALSQSEERYRTLFESIDEGFCVIQLLLDENGTPKDYRFLEINPAFEHQTGLQQALGKTIRQLVPDIEEYWIKLFGQVALTGEAVRYEDHASSMNRWFEGYVYSVGALEERKVAILFKDISDRKRAEQALQESEERFRTLADNISQLAWMGDRDGGLFWYNRRWFEFTGTTLEQMQGWGWQQVHHPAHVERVVEHFRNCIERGERWEDTFPLRGRDGTYRWFLSRAIPIKNTNGEILRWFGTNTDITDLKEAQKELQERNKELDSFVYIVSHDLKAPLRAVANLSEWIAEDIQGLVSVGTQQHMTLLTTRVQRMSKMIDGLLDYARVGRVDTLTESVAVAELLEEVIDMVAPPPTFTILIAPNLPVIETKRLLLFQVFANLIGNCIKHHHRLDGAVQVLAKDKEDYYEFAVADDGQGIAPEHLDKIFKIFQTPRAKSDSTGVGLAIVKKIVESEKGSIRVESQLGKGTAFYFTWPK